MYVTELTDKHLQTNNLQMKTQTNKFSLQIPTCQQQIKFSSALQSIDISVFKCH